MTIPNLGRLEQVDPRQAWTSEANDFTPWLAQPENLRLLGDAIGIDLGCEGTEREVGPFRADILCKDTATGDLVLVENQLERTDHTHLGQLLTYAAGLQAVTIVWIARRFTDEHRAALDWLNEITGEKFNFFGLEMELWRIGNSLVAPKFNVVCQPNDWRKTVAGDAARSPGGLGKAKQIQLEFWLAFREYVMERGSIIKPGKALPQYYITMPLGRSGFRLSAVASFWDKASESYATQELRAEVVIEGRLAKEYFAALEKQRAPIEKEIGEPLAWDNRPERKKCLIYVRRDANLEDRAQWPEQQEWLLRKLEALHRAFAPRIQRLGGEGGQPSGDGALADAVVP